jgi:Domain of unknown function (DUF4375)
MGKREYEPGEVYWSLVEPFWGKISIYDGAEQFLRQFRALPKHVGHLFAGHWCQSEVCNGGFHKFFWNPTGILAPEALQAYQAIGIPVWAAIVKEAMQYFGEPYPREQFDRPVPERIPGKKREEWNPFYSLDERFYDWIRDGGDWCCVADEYASKFCKKS